MNMVYDKSVSVTLHYVEHECESKNECTFKYLLGDIEIIQSRCAMHCSSASQLFQFCWVCHVWATRTEDYGRGRQYENNTSASKVSMAKKISKGANDCSVVVKAFPCVQLSKFLSGWFWLGCQTWWIQWYDETCKPWQCDISKAESLHSSVKITVLR